MRYRLRFLLLATGIVSGGCGDDDGEGVDSDAGSMGPPRPTMDGGATSRMDGGGTVGTDAGPLGSDGGMSIPDGGPIGSDGGPSGGDGGMRVPDGGMEPPESGFLTRISPVETATLSVADVFDASGDCRIDENYQLVGTCPRFCAEESREAAAECPRTECEASGFDYDCSLFCELEAFDRDPSEPLEVTSETAYDQAFGATFEMNCSLCSLYADQSCFYAVCTELYQAVDRCLIENDLGPDAEDFSLCRTELDALFDCSFSGEAAVARSQCYREREEACFADHT